MGLSRRTFSREFKLQIEDALAVCFSFNVIGRLADAFGFFVPADEAFDAGAKYLLARGYH